MADIKRIKTIFQFRRATTEEWNLNQNTIPAAGEPCYDLDRGTLKIGDGTSFYKDLKVIGGASISDDGLSLAVEDLQADVEILQELVGKTSVADQISGAMTDVVKVSDLEDITNSVETLESQVIISNDSVVEMKTIVENNNTVITELQTTIKEKADSAAVETLETDMKTYIEERIQLIEKESMDGGVIE